MKKILYSAVLILAIAVFALCGCGETSLPDNPDNTGGGTGDGSGGKTTYTITFVVDGETLETQTLNPGDTIADPTADYRKEGYTFVGWQRPDGKIINWNYASERKATGDLTLTAYYSVNSYKIDFYYMDEKLGDTQKLKYDSEFTFPTGFITGTAVELVGWRVHGSEELITASTGTVKRDTRYDAVVRLKPYESIELKGFPTESYYLCDYVCDAAEVVLTYADGSEYSLQKSEYEVVLPEGFGKELKDYEVKIKIKLEENLERSLMVTVKTNKNKISVLFIGNSYSDDTIDLSYNVAKSLGINNVEIATLYYPGCTIDQHLEFLRSNPRNYIFRYFDASGRLSTTETDFSKAQLSTMEEGIKFKDWDFIVLQQGSRDSGLPGTYGNVNSLISYVRSKATNPHVRFAFNMTWAYATGSSNYGFANYGNNQQTMYNGIINSVKTQIEPNKDFVAIIPNGTAVQNARTSSVGDNLTRDMADHLTYDLGRYVAALTFVGAISGMDITDVQYAPGGLTQTYVGIAKESAINAIKSPYTVTKSAYVPADESSIVGKTQKTLTFTQGYYDSSRGDGNHYTIVTWDGNLSPKFFATAKFTKEELPVGSVIYIADGWQYRPEGWLNGNFVSPRQNNVSTKYVIVTEEWWGNYTERAFNISKVGIPAITGEADNIPNVFKIYLPN